MAQYHNTMFYYMLMLQSSIGALAVPAALTSKHLFNPSLQPCRCVVTCHAGPWVPTLKSGCSSGASDWT
jgi:hypothetical protein